jgi:hypothetical protein
MQQSPRVISVPTQFAGIGFSVVLETEIECTKITLPFTKNAYFSHGISTAVQALTPKGDRGLWIRYPFPVYSSIRIQYR